MLKYRGDNDNLKQHIFTLRVVIVVLILFCGLFWHSAEEAKKVQRVHIPADLRQGATVSLNQVPDTTAYAFAYKIFQYLNTWLTDGAQDYPDRVQELAAYLTPTYQEWLKTDIIKRNNRGEIKGRTRTLTPISSAAFDPNMVQILSNDRFVVWMDFRIDEYQSGINVKTVKIRYPIKVVKTNIGIEFNPWGLALDGYAADPTKIIEEAK